jgi:hypothetical protein
MSEDVSAGDSSTDAVDSTSDPQPEGEHSRSSDETENSSRTDAGGDADTERLYVVQLSVDLESNMKLVSDISLTGDGSLRYSTPLGDVGMISSGEWLMAQTKSDDQIRRMHESGLFPPESVQIIQEVF